MLIYLSVFLISLIFFIVANYFKESRFIFYILCAFGLVVPIYFAAARDYKIGTDIYVYGLNFFKEACVSNSFSAYYKNVETDFLYALLNYAISRFTHDFFWFLFFLQGILFVSVFYSALNFRKSIPIWIPILFYFLSLYNFSFNILRQSLAIAFCLLFFVSKLKGRSISAFIFMALTILSHQIGIICLLYYLFEYISAIRSGFIKYTVIVGFLLLSVFFVLYFQVILNVLTSVQVGERYDYYSNNDKTAFSLTGTLLCLFNIFLIYNGYRYKALKDSLYFYLLMIALTELIFSSFSIIANNLQRTALFFNCVSFIYVPLILFNHKIPQLKRYLFQGIYFVFLFYLWYGVYIQGNYGQTVPYSSKILNI